MSNSTIVTNTNANAIVGINLTQEIVFTETSNFGYFITPLRQGFNNFKGYAQSVTFTITAYSAPASFNVMSTSTELTIVKTSQFTWSVSSNYTTQQSSGNSWAKLNAVINGLYFTFTKADYTADFFVQVQVTNGVTTDTGTITFNGWITSAVNIVQNVSINEDRFGWKFSVDGQGQPAIADPDQAGRTYRVTYEVVGGGNEICKLNAPNAGTGSSPTYTSSAIFTGTQAQVNSNMSTMTLDMGPDYNQNFSVSYTQEILSGTPGSVTRGSFTFTVVPDQASAVGTGGSFVADVISKINLATINDTRGVQAGLSYTCTANLPDSTCSLSPPWVRSGTTNTYTLVGTYSVVQPTLLASSFITTSSNSSGVSIDLTITRPQQKGSVDWSGTQNILTGTINLIPFESGILWKEQTAPLDKFQAVCATPTHFVAVGKKCCMHSTDGITWNSSSLLTDMYGVCYGEGLTVAAGQNYIARSGDNGQTWTYTSNMSGAFFYGVSYDPIGKFIAYGSQFSTSASNVYTSQDGINWTAKPKVNADIGACVYFENAWYSSYAVYNQGYGRPMVGKTTDFGLTWSTVFTNQGTITLNRVDGMAASGEAIAWLANPAVWGMTLDNWGYGTSNLQAVGNSCAFGNGVFIGVTGTGIIARATGVGLEGRAWSEATFPTALGKLLTGVAYKKGVFVVVRDNGSSSVPTLGSVYTNSPT